MSRICGDAKWPYSHGIFREQSGLAKGRRRMGICRSKAGRICRWRLLQICCNKPPAAAGDNPKA
jgi:hypothetical protein